MFLFPPLFPQGNDLVVKARQAALVLADQLGLKCALTLAGHFNAWLTTIGEHRLGATAIAVVGSALRLGLSAGVAQVVAHLRVQGAFDECLFEILEDVFKLLFGHGARDELLK